MADAVGQPAQVSRTTAGVAVSLPGRGECRFTSRAVGDFTDPSPEQLRELAESCGAGSRSFARSRQVHRAGVLSVADPGQIREEDEYDGQVTSSREVVCAVRTADCLPVALLSVDAAGVVHAGWRGLAAGVIGSGVAAMREVGGSPVTAVIGPGARSCCYEAGPEVHEAFAPLGAGAREGANANLPWVAAEQLSGLGVVDVIDCGLCTICDEEWHSYRRDGDDAGRSLALAWRS